MKFNVLACLACLVVSGCATPYGEKGAFGGYTDKEIAPGKFMVKVDGNAWDSTGKMKEYWHRRAGELCEGTGYTGSPKVGERKVTTMSYSVGVAYPDTNYYPYAKGVVECEKNADGEANQL